MGTVLLFLIQQYQFHLSTLSDRWNYFPLITTKADVVVMDIAVAAFYVLNEAALWVAGVPHEGAITDVIGKGGKEKAVFAVGTEHFAELVEVTAKQGIGLLSGEWKTEMFSGLDAVTISDIGIIPGMV